MGDYGFGLLQTANISSGSTRFGGGAFTPYPSASPVRPSSSPLVSPLFPSHQRNMQDEPAGLTASQSDSEQTSAADSDPSRFSAVGHAQTAGDLQRDRNTHQQTDPPPQQPYSSSSSSSSSSTGLDTNAPSSKVKPQMESPSAHHINNGTGGNNMLAAAAFPEMQSPGGGGGSVSPSLPAFGTPWSVQTSSPPPPVSNAANAINQIPTTEPDNFYPGIPSSINPGFFQSFSANPCPVQGFSNPFSPQINAPPQSRRSPLSPQMPPQQGAFLHQRNNYNHHQPMMKQSPWGSHQGSGWTSGGVSWGRDHRRGGGMGVPGSLNQISPMKKPFSSNVIAPPKFPRSAGSLGPKSWIEENMFRTDNNSNTLLPLQDRSRMYDSLNMHSLESSLIDIMRAEQDPLKGRSSLFPIDDGLLDDGHGNQGVLGSPHCYPHQNGERIERFSRKVFVGGLPPDIDEDEITSSFRRFGHLVVDWPHKAESKSYFPPKGYAFLLFQEESSVQALIEACLEEDGKLYLCVSSPTIKDKPVQIRPWNLSDSDFVMDGSQPLDPRKTIFVGGVPRPLRAVELAMIMDRLYGGVCYAGIDTDPELKYPKGAGRVAFSNQQSYIAAISARFVQLQHGDIDKRVEVKPYVLDDQLCDECQGARCGGKFAPFFCANVTCLQYYCEFCWANIHSRAGREFHKPLVKEGADRPRQIHFRWN
ncbi:cytoplasmic polyadenylation element-binding protein 2 isoform X5 [Carassius auratus]|uniref:Cytoplasmic polyadenylation element-binding protein 2 isoform X5 n=1 Tax=Carassius auratus TaxID=7957 RepID=A0A6P6J6E7_CARAU|nr:cytoplasmic polyadenylation element-binding protein 2-like isoform X5 [Carassius auratus]